MSIPKFTFALKSIQSIADSTELGKDEPYVLIIGVDFTNIHAMIINTALYGPFSLAESQTATTFDLPFGTPAAVYDALDALNVVPRRPFWGLLNHMPTPLGGIENVGFVMILMENDDGDPEAIRNRLHLEAQIAMAKLVAKFPVSITNSDVLSALDSMVFQQLVTGGLDSGLNKDDFIHVQAFRLEQHDVRPPLVGRREVHLPLFSDSPEGAEGVFRVILELAFS